MFKKNIYSYELRNAFANWSVCSIKYEIANLNVSI